MKKIIIIGLILMITGVLVSSRNIQVQNNKNTGYNDIEKLFLNHETLTELLSGSNIIKDSIYADFNKDSLLDMAIILEDTIRLVSEDEYRIQYKPKQLLVFLNRDNETPELITNLTSIFESQFKDLNWGINGNDAFSDMNWIDGNLSLTFDTGEMLRLNEEYHFILNSRQWELTTYILEGYEIMDVDSEGIIRNIYIHKYDFLKGEVLNYTKNNNIVTDSTVEVIKQEKILLSDFNAWKGVVDRPM